MISTCRATKDDPDIAAAGTAIKADKMMHAVTNAARRCQDAVAVVPVSAASPRASVRPAQDRRGMPQRQAWLTEDPMQSSAFL